MADGGLRTISFSIIIYHYTNKIYTITHTSRIASLATHRITTKLSVVFDISPHFLPNSLHLSHSQLNPHPTQTTVHCFHFLVLTIFFDLSAITVAQCKNLCSTKGESFPVNSLGMLEKKSKGGREGKRAEDVRTNLIYI